MRSNSLGHQQKKKKQKPKIFLCRNIFIYFKFLLPSSQKTLPLVAVKYEDTYCSESLWPNSCCRDGDHERQFFFYTLPKAPITGHYGGNSRLLGLSQYIHSQVTSLLLCWTCQIQLLKQLTLLKPQTIKNSKVHEYCCSVELKLQILPSEIV